MTLGTLVLLGLVLSLDSFRVSLGLGALRLRPVKQAQIVAAFGLCDGLAPLAGMVIGQSLTRFMSGFADYLGPALLGLYGAFVIYADWRWDDDGGQRDPSVWVVFGLPLSLSLDNLIAGASLGLNGLPLPVCVGMIGGCSALAALTGLRLGQLVRTIPALNREWVAGAALIVIAAVLAMEGSQDYGR